MSFILVPRHGEDVQVNAWNWRPTLMLVRNANLVDEETYERMGTQGCGGQVDAETAARIAALLERQLVSMQPGQRIRADLTVTDKPRKLAVFTPGMKAEDVDANELYSATYEWLVVFKDFCRSSGGFEVSWATQARAVLLLELVLCRAHGFPAHPEFRDYRAH